jgi:hypothetical protein
VGSVSAVSPAAVRGEVCLSYCTVINGPDRDSTSPVSPVPQEEP